MKGSSPASKSHQVKNKSVNGESRKEKRGSGVPFAVCEKQISSGLILWGRSFERLEKKIQALEFPELKEFVGSLNLIWVVHVARHKVK